MYTFSLNRYKREFLYCLKDGGTLTGDPSNNFVVPKKKKNINNSRRKLFERSIVSKRLATTGSRGINDLFHKVIRQICKIHRHKVFFK